jgi:glyoxylase-like metal-dependent hydrolase (beta-lactamase superfamily II)
VLHTPGHSPDHLTFWHAQSRTLFVGDMLVQGSTVVIPASVGGSLAEYLRSLERMLQLNPSRALPAHGPVIDDPAALIRKYVEHRAQREGQVLDALAAGESTVAAITASIYPSLVEALVPMARESVLAHLLKLEGERRVARDGDRWLIA